MTPPVESVPRSNGHTPDAEVRERTDRDRADGTFESEETNGRSGDGRKAGKGDRTRRGGDEAVYSTGRWRGIVAVALIAVAVGVLAKRPSLLLVAAVGVAFAAYPRITSVPDPDLYIDRQIDPETPDDGEAVHVRTTIENRGEEMLFDLRIVDGTPPMLRVCGNSPRRATALEPGEEVTVEYELRARPGRHRFQPTTILCRDASGSVEVETTITERSTIECASRIPSVPLRSQAQHRTGPLVTDEGGSGLEFHSIKEYERGDATSRIDWRRFARTGELTSVAFRAERLADVVICVDARAAAYRASDASEPHAVAHAVDAAGRIADGLFDVGHRVGLAAFGRDVCLLPLGTGRDHAHRFHRQLTTDPALTLAPPQSVRTTRALSGAKEEPTSDETASLDRQRSRIRAQFGGDAQLVLLSPLCDDEAARIAQRFESDGFAVTVVSPDVTTDRTPGGTLARLERNDRVSTLRNANVPVADWDPTTSLGTALATLERWDR